MYTQVAAPSGDGRWQRGELWSSANPFPPVVSKYAALPALHSQHQEYASNLTQLDDEPLHCSIGMSQVVMCDIYH